MSLISKDDFIQAAGLEKAGFLKKPLATTLMRVSKLHKINALYDALKDKEGEEFFRAFLTKLEIDYMVFKEDLARIPEKGPFILVANHALGALDGILMTYLISQIRPDFKIMGNFLLSNIKPMEPYVIAVNPFAERREAYSSINGMRKAMRHLDEGGCFGVFPAGEVSNKNNEENEVLDKEWELPILKLIHRMQVPILPMYFHAENSEKFYRMARIHPDLQTLLLPSEMIRKREEPVRIRIGKPVTSRIQKEFDVPEDLGRFLRKKVYMMRSYFDRRGKIVDFLSLPNIHKNFSPKGRDKVVEHIIPETSKDMLVAEIAKLKEKEGKLLFSKKNYDVFFSSADDIPYILREIGRQREITFREVGEGTNMAFDLDEYDKHYHHLFLWDSEAEKLAGAYRLALGKEVMKRYGVEGFYSNTLFEFDKVLHMFFGRVIEMGRAYILTEYQRKPLSLYLLWRGIVHVCLRNPGHQFLLGSVSISDKFHDFSKTLMIEFMKSHYYDSVVGQYVHARNEYKVRLTDKEKLLFFEGMGDDLNKFDRLIDDFEPELRMPVLIKKYIKQNAKVIAFNVDPNFNDAIDGLMYIRISDIPEDTIKPVLEELEGNGE